MAARACFSPLLLLLSAAIFLGLLSPLCIAHNILYSGERLNPGQYLSYGSYKLIMQEDCNFVLYDNGPAVWASGTYHRAKYCYVTMQSDGNLVIYNKEGKALWASNTNKEGRGNYVLVLQRDRNVVIYGGSLWATATNTYGTGVGLDKSLAAGVNITASPLGSVAEVVNINGGEEQYLIGGEISMVTTKEN